MYICVRSYRFWSFLQDVLSICYKTFNSTASRYAWFKCAVIIRQQLIRANPNQLSNIARQPLDCSMQQLVCSSVACVYKVLDILWLGLESLIEQEMAEMRWDHNNGTRIPLCTPPQNRASFMKDIVIEEPNLLRSLVVSNLKVSQNYTLLQTSSFSFWDKIIHR